MYEQPPSCRDCLYCHFVDIRDPTGLKASAGICGLTGRSADAERMQRYDNFGLPVEPEGTCGPNGNQFVARAG